jgi:hypothetical protein
MALAAEIENPNHEMWDHLLPLDLLGARFASPFLDVGRVMAALQKQALGSDERPTVQLSASSDGNFGED